MNNFSTASIILALGLAGCSGGVEGTYTLDKAEVKKAVQTELAGQSGGGPVFDFFTKMIDEVEMTVDLRAGGKVSLKSTLPTGPYVVGRPPQFVTTEDKEGMWKTDGEIMVITAGGNSLRCSKLRSKMICQPDKKLFFPLLFVKF